ncbi:hypothetical protein V6Z11_D02G048100 [Gossypium hirsutum]
MAKPYIEQVEYLDVLTKIGKKTGVFKPRGDVHRDGDYHKAVHVWIFAQSTQELLLQKRADCKDSWPGLWDISSAGHISASDSSLITAHIWHKFTLKNGVIFFIVVVLTLACNMHYFVNKQSTGCFELWPAMQQETNMQTSIQAEPDKQQHFVYFVHL